MGNGAVLVHDVPRRVVHPLDDLLRLFDGFVDAAEFFLRFVEARARFVDEMPGHFHRVDRLLGFLLESADDGADLVGEAAALLREFADLVRDDGEAASCLSGACRFDGGIQGEKVRLLGNRLDHLAGHFDLFRALVRLDDDASHFFGRSGGFCRFLHDIGEDGDAFILALAHGSGSGIDFFEDFLIAVEQGLDFVQVIGGLLRVLRLFRCTVGNVVDGRRHVARAVGRALRRGGQFLARSSDGLGIAIDLSDDVAQAARHLAAGACDDADFIAALQVFRKVHIFLFLQIESCKALDHARHIL